MPTPPTILTLVGNPRPGGRTSQVARAVAEQVARGLGGADVHDPIELGVHADAVLAPADVAVDRDRRGAAAADVLVVASPTYKATYTGLLKAFFDQYDATGLRGVVAVPVMLGGSPAHALAVEVHLRPLLVELGAVVPGRGLYVLDQEVDDIEAVVGPWWDHNGAAICSAAGQGGAR